MRYPAMEAEQLFVIARLHGARACRSGREQA
ncbi:hypothetical protein BX257_0182 [Streptomyces sp. 3212.3]|nr:hypothetical protein BX257_0182 [Streptomyces sp. 3212.3]